MNKLVRESIEAVLKPKTDTDIIEDSKPLIDEFIDSISQYEFEQAIEAVNGKRYSNADHVKKLTRNGKDFYLSTEEGVYDLIDELVYTISTGQDKSTGDYYYKREDFGKFWTEFQTSDKAHYDSIMNLMHYIYDRFAEKFNIEY